jgi:hypothetical protein
MTASGRSSCAPGTPPNRPFIDPRRRIRREWDGTRPAAGSIHPPLSSSAWVSAMRGRHHGPRPGLAERLQPQAHRAAAVRVGGRGSTWGLAVAGGFLPECLTPVFSASGVFQAHARRVLLTQLAVPRPFQNGQETASISGHPRAVRTASDLGKRRLTRCVKRPSKQRVADSDRAGHQSQDRLTGVGDSLPARPVRTALTRSISHGLDQARPAGSAAGAGYRGVHPASALNWPGNSPRMASTW